LSGLAPVISPALIPRYNKILVETLRSRNPGTRRRLLKPSGDFTLLLEESKDNKRGHLQP